MPKRPKNMAFKCTYNDGGLEKNGIGFLGVCSDQLIRQHIHDGRVWCSHPACPCKQYVDGAISRDQLDSRAAEGQTRYDDYLTCYESRMLRLWMAQAGTKRNGAQEGERIRIKNAFRNGIAVLTTRIPGTAEEDRFIFGLFLIDTIFEGDDSTSGYVSAQSRYRLAFTLDEARRLPYWKYHANKNNPSKPSWGTGLFRYLSDHEGVQILRDAIEVKQGTADEQLAREFLEQYCRMNDLAADAVGDPAGALVYRT